MWALLERFFGESQREGFLTIEGDSNSRLSMRQGRHVVAFDRLSRAVTQQGKLVSPFGNIRHIRVRQEAADGGAAVFSVNLELAGSRVIRVGSCPDAAGATRAAERIAAVTGVRVDGP